MVNQLKGYTSILLLAILISCGGYPLHAADTEVIVWVYTAHSTELNQSWHGKIKQWFEEENPGTTLKIEYNTDAGGEKLIAAVAAGVPPDVSIVSPSRARGFYERGLFMDLNDYISRSPEVAPDQFLPVSTQVGEKDGKIFGLPRSLEGKALQYNRDHFAEAGLDIDPKAMTSWDDVIDNARRLVERDSSGNITRSGMVLGRGLTNFAAYLYSNGGRFYNDTGTQVAFNDSRGIEALEMMRQYAHEYDVTRPGANWIDIANRTASMVIADTSATGRLREAARDFASWIEMVAIPPGPQGDRSSSVGWSSVFVIPTGAKNPDLGWKFIELWLSTEKVIGRFEHIEKLTITAPRRDFFESNAFFDSLREVPYMANMPELFSNAGPYPHIKYSEISSGITSLLTQAERAGTLAPQAALAEAERIANSILSE